MMELTRAQQQKVEENMGLVGKVIKDKVHGINQHGAYSYEDLYQIGCFGLCKAAATDKGGCFSTYAYRLIWNEICDELIKTTRLVQREESADAIGIIRDKDAATPDPFHTIGFRHALEKAKVQASGATLKGIQCLELASQGFSSKDIGQIHHAEAATIRMWMTKARRYLQTIPELQAYAEV